MHCFSTMKPILRDIQNTVVKFLRDNEDSQNIDIIPRGLSSIENLQLHHYKQIQPTQLHVSYPIPLQSAADISGLFWNKIALQLTLIKKYTLMEDVSAYEQTEQISYILSHQPLITPSWEVCFELNYQNPWKDLTNQTLWQAIQMNFTSSKFNLSFA